MKYKFYSFWETNYQDVDWFFQESGIYLGVKTCEVFLCFVAIFRVRVDYVDFLVFFVLRHQWVLQVFTPWMSRNLKFTLTLSLPRSQCLPYTSYFSLELFPGLFSLGKCHNKIPGLGPVRALWLDRLNFAWCNVARVWHSCLACAMKDCSGLEKFQSQQMM